MRALLVACICSAACAAPPPAAESAPSAAGAKPEKCASGPPPERVEVAVGATAITESDIAVSFRGASHDHFEDGRTDLLLHLVFQGVLEDDELTPSALSWQPSAFAKPSWTYLSVNRCVRVIEPGEERVVLEIFEPES